MIGFEVADGAIPSCHAEPLNEQVWEETENTAVMPESTLKASEWSLSLP